jgi:hypothetical protein
MAATHYLRVVTLRKGRLKPGEFTLRKGERGLSLFAVAPRPAPQDIIEAVREMGKSGDLRAAEISGLDLKKMGLDLIKTLGNTGIPEINAIHYEARIPWYRLFFLWFRGWRKRDYFNSVLSPEICSRAKILET